MKFFDDIFATGLDGRSSHRSHSRYPFVCRALQADRGGGRTDPERRPVVDHPREQAVIIV